MEEKRISEITYGSLAFATQMAYVEDAHGTQKFLENFNILYRYITKEARIVTLENEISALKNFIDIQKMRFGNKFEATVKSPSDNNSSYIDKLVIIDIFDRIIQNYIEEAESYVNVYINLLFNNNELCVEIIIKSDSWTKTLTESIISH